MNKKKYSLIFFLLITLCNSFYGQDVNELFFDEASVSFNRTNMKDENTENRNGFGLGIYHSFFARSMLNLTFGIEYNRTNQFKKSMYEGHYAHATDLTYNLNMLSFPAGMRLNIGNNVNVFIEAGAFADLMIKSTREGIMHTYFPDANNQVVFKDYPFDEKADLSNSFGVYTGLGIRIPVSGFEIVVKGDYKHGLSELYSYMDVIYNRYWRIALGVKMK